MRRRTLRVICNGRVEVLELVVPELGDRASEGVECG